MDYSQITVVGRVQPRDAEVRYTQGGLQALAFRMVVNRKRRTAAGLEDAADWYQVTAFGKLAEQVERFATKGQRILVSGRFSSRVWTDAEGREHTSLEIVANDVIALTFQDVPRQENQPETESANDLDDLPF